jgi:hypothetical protein
MNALQVGAGGAPPKMFDLSGMSLKDHRHNPDERLPHIGYRKTFCVSVRRRNVPLMRLTGLVS